MEKSKEASVEKCRDGKEGQKSASANAKSYKGLLKSLARMRQQPNRHEELASKTSQWTWTNKQCREWITAVSVWYLGYDEVDGEKAAAKFQGFGPSLFATTIRNWEMIFGNKHKAHSVCMLIYNLQREKGAVPRSIGVHDPWKEVQ
ncbi:uncharacterized protein LY89DRAFT_741515 [Mollisia scopiformis]|uniref:Uncharacterized protein n=1 Tax=Mollisia scopiformis TaxID=149040 RepID=A0A132B8T5_MOLSC|nr:uncharacterized protein LY89DRAFT_741515 [Mollisia scopiformis]KUJ08663.1 hypothetical protein LY89DRAFT_741515 [Mollisia scopiformis]